MPIILFSLNHMREVCQIVNFHSEIWVFGLSKIRFGCANVRVARSWVSISLVKERFQGIQRSRHLMGSSSKTLELGAVVDLIVQVWMNSMKLLAHISKITTTFRIRSEETWLSMLLWFQRQLMLKWPSWALASISKKPTSDTTNAELLKPPTSDKISNVISFREAKEDLSSLIIYLQFSESIPCSWMGRCCPSSISIFLKDFKAKAPIHVDWVKSWIAFLMELQAFVKKNHTTGLVWNPKGGEAKSACPPPPPSGGPPLPPPPPPPGLFDDVAPNKDDSNSSRNDLLDELNKGSDITKGLKKKSASTSNKSFTAPAKVNKAPKFELDGKKWVVEFQKDNAGLIVRDTEVNQSIYAYKCEGCVLRVNGKINNIILDSCKKTSVVFDSLVSSCEFVNCQSIKMQVMGKVPTISIDKSDGCQMYLSEESYDVVIVSSKSSEMNVLISNGEDYVEYPIAEQFKTTFAGQKLQTMPTESV
ncbi:CAP1_2 [Lepeophtheirus salmonis]|uniref:CAP1_2 n=1 Tax=Lepeophtheirus salmonis TaxID=72036 RepID=A0A7R8CM56_LEPSM|nr:CAP1_2 [Lepeophtheirus salmonis]CAF2861050.1 CAP1_2 [Lepeophtheirus salmonis]